MKIAAAFIIALTIGAISRWARIPLLAPQAIVGALLIVAMTAGYVLTDRYLQTQASLNTLFQTSHRVISSGAPLTGTPEALVQQKRSQVETLQSLVAELVATNESLRQRLHDYTLHP